MQVNERDNLATSSATDMISRVPALRWAFNYKDWHPSKEQFLFCLKCIQPVERSRVLDYVFKKDAKPALIGRLMLRKCVAETALVPYDSVELNRTDKGKPQMDPNGNNSIAARHFTTSNKFDLNVSHQGDYCVLASDAFSKVGVDTMKLEFVRNRKLSEFFDTMKRQFSDSEWKYIREPGVGGGDMDTDRVQLFRFMRLWTLKESYVKAEGFGITVDLQAISFECPTKDLSSVTVTTDTRLMVDGRHLVDWTFEESLIDDLHCAAVAFNEATTSADHGHRQSNLFKRLTYEQLIDGAKPLDGDIDGDRIWSIYSSKQERPGAF